MSSGRTSDQGLVRPLCGSSDRQYTRRRPPRAGGYQSRLLEHPHAARHERAAGCPRLLEQPHAARLQPGGWPSPDPVSRVTTALHVEGRRRRVRPPALTAPNRRGGGGAAVPAGWPRPGAGLRPPLPPPGRTAAPSESLDCWFRSRRRRPEFGCRVAALCGSQSPPLPAVPPGGRPVESPGCTQRLHKGGKDCPERTTPDDWRPTEWQHHPDVCARLRSRHGRKRPTSSTAVQIAGDRHPASPSPPGPLSSRDPKAEGGQSRGGKDFGPSMAVGPRPNRPPFDGQKGCLRGRFPSEPPALFPRTNRTAKNGPRRPATVTPPRGPGGPQRPHTAPNSLQRPIPPPHHRISVSPPPGRLDLFQISQQFVRVWRDSDIFPLTFRTL